MHQASRHRHPSSTRCSSFKLLRVVGLWRSRCGAATALSASKLGIGRLPEAKSPRSHEPLATAASRSRPAPSAFADIVAIPPGYALGSRFLRPSSLGLSCAVCAAPVYLVPTDAWVHSALALPDVGHRHLEEAYLDRVATIQEAGSIGRSNSTE
jgi:hypothetical protein